MMTRISVLLLTCLPLAAAFTSPASFAGAGQRSGLQSATSPASRLHNVALRAPKAATGVSALNMKVPKIIQGGMGVQVGQPPALENHLFAPCFPRTHPCIHEAMAGLVQRIMPCMDRRKQRRRERRATCFRSDFLGEAAGISRGVWAWRIRGGADSADSDAR
jgi:hypothetical protein